MSDLNLFQAIGRLGKACEIRYMPSGEGIASFSIACGSSWKNKEGEKQVSTEWINCTAFGKLAEICGEYLKKGSQVYISGRMQTDKYKDKEGVEKYSTKIIVGQMQMLGGKPAEENQPSPKPAAKPASSGFDDLDDDIF